MNSQERVTPVGLVIQNGKLISPIDLSKKVLSGIIYSRDKSIAIELSNSHSSLMGVDSALQSGPLLVDPGGTLGIKANDRKRTNRTAICLQWDGKAVVALVSKTAQTTGGLVFMSWEIYLRGSPLTVASVAKEPSIWTADLPPKRGQILGAKKSMCRRLTIGKSQILSSLGENKRLW